MIKRYLDAPDVTPETRSIWQQLAECNARLADSLSLTISVQSVGQPYARHTDMIRDINRGCFRVTSEHSEHPVWTTPQNVDFRVVHDVLGHYVSQGDFSLYGETLAYMAHAALLPVHLRSALFTEVIGQRIVGDALGYYPPQKCVLLK